MPAFLAKDFVLFSPLELINILIRRRGSNPKNTLIVLFGPCILNLSQSGPLNIYEMIIYHNVEYNLEKKS